MGDELDLATMQYPGSLGSQISIVIAWSSRREIVYTLRRNAPLFKKYLAEVIVVVSGCQIASLIALLKAEDISGVRCIEINSSKFNKALALNVGVSVATSPNIFVLDADIVLTSDVIGEAISQVTDTTFCGVEWVDEAALDSTAEMTAEVFAQALADANDARVEREVFITFKFSDGRTIRQNVVKQCLNTGARSAPGLIIVQKRHLLAIGGYDSRVALWGWEDNDVILRLQNVLGLRKIDVGSALHLSHGNESRALPQEGAYMSNMTNLAHFAAAYARGEFRGTYWYDLAASVDQKKRDTLDYGQV